MLKAVLFDVDGTLGDTLPLCVEAYRTTVYELRGQRPSAQEVVSHFGLSDRGVLGALLGMHPDDAELPIGHFVQVYCRLLPQMAPAPFDGVAEMLAGLRQSGLRLGIVTGKEACTARPTFTAFGLDEAGFEWFGFGSPFSNVKAQRLREGADFFGISPAELLYVGDAPSDITLAHAAGVRILNAAWAPDSDSCREACLAEKPDFRLSDIRDVLPLILSLI